MRAAGLSQTAPKRSHLLTVAVEDYFHATAINPLIAERHQSRMESRASANVDSTLELLARYDQTATFFILGWVAERLPEVVKRIAEAGHEVASKGYEHQPLASHTLASFRESVRRSKRAVEQASGRRVLGFRIPEGHLSLGDLWALDVLAEEGYSYDSSFYPRLRSLAGQPWRRFPHVHERNGLKLEEFPLSTGGVDGFLLPAAGGNYFRQLPQSLMQLSFSVWDRRYLSPFNMYFHTWELDPDLPDIATADSLARLRQYRNLDQMRERLAHYFENYRFTSIVNYRRWVQEPLSHAPGSARPVSQAPSSARLSAARQENAPSKDRVPITIVVPCFNEGPVLGYLENTLGEVTLDFRDRYDVKFVLVNDSSTDDTWEGLKERFLDREDVKLVTHETNQGVAAAIMTGIRAADTEVVCSMDADCTYDPHQLKALLDLLGDDVAMVTASPYHKDGHVVGVPEWRLLLSRNLSRMYGALLRHRFATYTACFRAYRKSKVEHIELANGGFLGVAELLIKLDILGERMVECPATLESRVLGASKLKTMSTIRGHLELIAQIPEIKRRTKAVHSSGQAS